MPQGEDYKYTPIKHCLAMIDETRKTWERFLKAAETDQEREFARGAVHIATQLDKYIKAYGK